MKLFKRKHENVGAPKGRNIIAERLSGFYSKLQSGWAEWMAQRTAPLSKKDWVITLCGFVLLMGGYSTYLIISGFTATKADVIAVTKLKQPAFAGKTGELEKAQAKISDVEYHRIAAFHRYMDSLAADPFGKKVYDSITKSRPGLLDSLKEAGHYYQLLKNK